MKYLTAMILAALMATSVQARPACGDTHRFGQNLVRAGDSERRAYEYRQPDRTVRLETRDGGAAGYRLDYYERGQTVQIYIRGGVVNRICRVRD